jgi:CDP-diacylglycerol--glycerol-3-phosphate 3-phosphatidyltransferase
MAAVEGQVMAAEELGKYKMVLQSIAIQGLLINYVYFHVDFFAAGLFVLWIAMVVTVWSGVEYYLSARAVLSPRMKPSARRAAV